MSAAKRKPRNKPLKEKCKIIRHILEQFQTHRAEPDEDDNDCDDETVNDVAHEWPSRLAVESSLDFLKNAALQSTMRDEAEREILFASKQTNITEFSVKLVKYINLMLPGWKTLIVKYLMTISVFQCNLMEI